jgi:SAM-dependent methyltransferase
MSQQDSRPINDTTEPPLVKTGYVFDNASPHTELRFSTVAEMFDPGTVRNLTEAGIGVGWCCLEVGGGGGSIASWLCDRVGPTGKVTATDIDTRFLDRLGKANLEVRRHDIVFDPLPDSAFDLVHARLVLMHIRERDRVLHRLVSALKPGGWIVAEEFDGISIRSDPLVNPVETSFKTFGVMHQVMVDRGVHLRFGRLLAGRVRGLGLTDIAAEGRIFMWQGRSAAAEMYRANIEQLRDAILETGLITDEEINHDLLQLNEESLVFPSPIMWTVRARRPFAPATGSHQGRKS